MLKDKSILKLFHFARFDLAVLQHTFGVQASPGLLHQDRLSACAHLYDRHGLKDLCRDLIGVEISKQQQSSDWGSETLTEAQLAYAASDVLHLHA